MDQGEKIKRKPCPKENANIISIVSFFYTLKIFIKGFRKDLEEEDIYEVIKKLKSKKLGDKLETQWLKEKANKRKLSLIRIMWFCYGRKFIFYGICELCMKTAISVTIPEATGRLVKYFSKNKDDMYIEDAYFYAAVVLIAKFVDMFLFHNYLLLLLELGTLIRTAFCSMIYRKCLKLSPAALNEHNTGKIVTLMTRDVMSMDSFVLHGNDLWISLVQTAVVTYFLYLRIGFSSLVGVGTFLLVIPLELYIGKKAGSMRIGTCQKTDVRLQKTQEALSAIKIIKMYTWEDFFAKKISAARKLEVVKLRIINILKSMMLCIGLMVSHISFYILLTVYIKYGSGVSPEKIFYAIGSYEYLRFCISLAIPYSVIHIAELGASIRRIGEFLNAEELPPTNFNSETGLKPKIMFNNATFKIKDKVILSNATGTISSGLNVVTGPLGSGKSSLLKVVLQDYPLTRGHLLVQGTISYACQDPWLFPASIKHNILFGESLDEERYQRVIRVCALKYDFDILAKGDETIVEDRGMNLSKGQQARINLARAIYRDSDIYLLDDCLAALDTTVQEHIFKECIKEFLKGKICLWVSHNVKSIKEADQVIVMEKGSIKSIVKPKDIPENEITQIIDNDMATKRKSLIECDMEEKEECDENSELLRNEEKIKENLYREVKKEGGVDFEMYKKYFSFGGGVLVFILVVCCFIGDQLSLNALDKIMSMWVNAESNVTKLVTLNDTNSTEYWESVQLSKSRLDLYFIMLVVAHLAFFLRCVVYLFYVSRIAINLHKVMIVKVINASMEFFDNTFIGNILNRFSRDLATIDEQLPFAISECARVLFQTVGIFGLIATVNPWYLIPSTIICIILVIMRRLYIPTGRSLKRLDSATRSPVVGHLNATLEGLTTIRAYGRQDMVREEFDRHQDLYTSAFHLSFMTQRAFAVALNFLTITYICFIVLHLLFYSDTLPGNVGLALTQAFRLTGTLQWGIRQWANLENQMTSVERTLEYTKIKQEDKRGKEMENWPSEGSIKYENVSLTYAKTKETVLRNINVSIHPRGKIGIVGRTGAGKSSIISTLFRLYEVDGRILIDDVNIGALALDFLRANISIIPQDPILFRVTVRQNIDPYGEYTDDQIWKVFDIVKLKELITDLDSEILDAGTQFSAGQRQLFCLARALIRKNKIIVMDEATANMDPETDTLISKIIKEQFESCTVLTIAHKLDTIMDSDKVMVLDKGEVVEYDTPVRLVQNKDSLFRSMSQKGS